MGKHFYQGLVHIAEATGTRSIAFQANLSAPTHNERNGARIALREMVMEQMKSDVAPARGGMDYPVLALCTQADVPEFLQRLTFRLLTILHCQNETQWVALLDTRLTHAGIREEPPDSWNATLAAERTLLESGQLKKVLS